MAKITDTGVQATSLEGYIEKLEGAFKSAFGENIDLDSETPQGQIIGILAQSLSQSDDAIVAVASANDIDQAYGLQIDGIANVLGVSRRDKERSLTPVILNGLPSTLIPAGSRAKTQDGDMFQLDEDVQLESNGSAAATMYSVEAGVVPAATGELSQIVDLVLGWETVLNTDDAILGRDVEQDASYRTQYKAQREKNALTIVGSIVGAIKRIEGVSDVIGRDNDKGEDVTVQNYTIPSHSVAVIVDGGSDSEIADAIYKKKTGGVGTCGDTTIPVRDDEGFDVDISFTRATYVPFVK